VPTPTPYAGSGTGGPTNGGEDIDGQIARLQEEMKAEQEQLDVLKKRKAVVDARKKDQDAIKNQRATSHIAIADAHKANDKWKLEIEKYLDANARGELDTKIGAVDQEIVDAEKAVSDLKAAVTADEIALANANKSLATFETQYADKQKEFSQLTAKIKDVQTRIEKLRAETKSAIDAKDWSHAYYKSYRLMQVIAEAGPLLALPEDPNGAENKLLAELKDLETNSTAAQAAAATAKTTLETHKSDLKAAEDELKRKKAGLETTIDAFL